VTARVLRKSDCAGALGIAVSSLETVLKMLCDMVVETERLSRQILYSTKISLSSNSL